MDREKRFKNARIKEAKQRNVNAIDRLLVNRFEYIKNESVRDKYKQKNRDNLKTQLALLKQKKSKLQEQLIPNEEEEAQNEETSDSEVESEMEEENMDEIKA